MNPSYVVIGIKDGKIYINTNVDYTYLNELRSCFDSSIVLALEEFAELRKMIVNNKEFGIPYPILLYTMTIKIENLDSDDIWSKDTHRYMSEKFLELFES